MKRFLIFSFFSLSFVCFAFDFPCDVKEPRSFFGQQLFQNTDGLNVAVENGITFGNVNVVQASDTGEKILVIEKYDSLNDFPSALGNAVVLKHGNGFQTVYGNLDSVQALEQKISFLKNENIGHTELTNGEKKKPLIFKVIDVNAKTKNFVNPVLMLPEIADAKKCEIKNVFLIDASGKKTLLTTRGNVASGKYKLFVECFDTVNNLQAHLSPFELNANLNGNNIANVILQTLHVQNGTMYVKDNFSIAQLYQRNNAFYLCDVSLSYGNAKLNIRVRDYNNNAVEVLFDLNVL
jgi:peptidase, M23 family